MFAMIRRHRRPMSAAPRRRPSRRHAYPPRIEPLEGRALLAYLQIVGGTVGAALDSGARTADGSVAAASLPGGYDPVTLAQIDFFNYAYADTGQYRNPDRDPTGQAADAVFTFEDSLGVNCQYGQSGDGEIGTGGESFFSNGLGTPVTFQVMPDATDGPDDPVQIYVLSSYAASASEDDAAIGTATSEVIDQDGYDLGGLQTEGILSAGGSSAPGNSSSDGFWMDTHVGATFSLATDVLLSHDVAYYAPAFGGSVGLEMVLSVYHPPTTATTTTTAVTAPNPSVVGQAVTFTATVAENPPGQQTPTGTVEFFDGTSSLGKYLLDANGVATCTTTSLGVGTHAITAQYDGDDQDQVSEGGTQQTVNPADTKTVVQGPAETPVYGQIVTFTAAVTAVAPGAGTPDGWVDFYLDGVELAPELLDNGVATYTASSLTAQNFLGAGQHVITAKYGGDPTFGFNASASVPLQQTIDQADTDVTLTSSAPLRPTYGQTVTLTAAVSAALPGAGFPTGEVDFFDNGNFLDSGTIDGGVATIKTDELDAGDNEIIATYDGDRNFDENDSDPLDLTVAKAPTSIIGTLGNSSVYGQKLTIEAIVSVFPPTATLPTGALELLEDSNTKPIAGVNPFNGVGYDFSRSDLAAGTHTLTVAYSGDENFASCDFTWIVTVSKAPLTVTVDDQDMAHGDPLPSLTWSFSGFVNGETAAVVSGTPTLSTAATPSSAAGHDPIEIAAGSLAASNYAFQFVPGTLTVHPRVLDVRVDYGSQSMSLIGLNRDLPFVDITGIDVLFSDDVGAAAASLLLKGAAGSYRFNDFAYDPETHDATWTLPTAIGVDRLLLSVDGGLGAVVDPSIKLMGTTSWNFAVLPGDYLGTGVVTIADALAIRNQTASFLPTGVVPSVWADLNGDGVVDINDVNLAKSRVGSQLPS